MLRPVVVVLGEQRDYRRRGARRCSSSPAPSSAPAARPSRCRGRRSCRRRRPARAARRRRRAARRSRGRSRTRRAARRRRRVERRAASTAPTRSPSAADSSPSTATARRSRPRGRARRCRAPASDRSRSRRADSRRAWCRSARRPRACRASRRVIVVPAVLHVVPERLVVVGRDPVQLHLQLRVVRREHVERRSRGGGIEHDRRARPEERRHGVADVERDRGVGAEVWPNASARRAGSVMR